MIGVSTADLSGGAPQQWTLQVAHVRYFLDLEMASGTYDMDMGNIKPLEQIATFFNFEFSKEGGSGASFFSRISAQLEYAATSALNIAQRSTSWLTRKSLRVAHEWWVRLNDDDSVSLCDVVRCQLFGGLSSSLMMNFVAGKVGFFHGGLDFLYFIADPEQPLDRNLRATLVRIASAKTRGDFDVHRPFVGHVLTGTWDGASFQDVYMK